MRGGVRIAVAAGAASIGTALLAVAGARRILGARGIPVLDALVAPGRRVLVVTAHPDDEIVMAGALAATVRRGGRVHLVTLTAGEASQSTELPQSPSALPHGERVAAVRRVELAEACRALGVELREVAGFPDGGLSRCIEPATAFLAEQIDLLHPDLVVGLDETVGIYGHPDHRAAATAARRAAQAAGVALLQATLAPRSARLAARLSPVLRRALAETGASHPAPSLAVRTRGTADAVSRAVTAHRSQRAVLAGARPGSSWIPGSLYAWIFDRDYFASVDPAE
ncbi:MAG: PIG-L family deacetylase [Protaetiibacter sp.]